ncbi:TPA: hypothetical protein EYO12_02430 [Candidatus Saccharibacteria bacterium]|nr:hypothetical protein [Candidatus Saccharibacteria bacterium]HIO87642.1 hypothetical protein [Candidatus Saccharibacteria bacterium]
MAAGAETGRFYVRDETFVAYDRALSVSSVAELLPGISNVDLLPAMFNYVRTAEGASNTPNIRMVLGFMDDDKKMEPNSKRRITARYQKLVDQDDMYIGEEAIELEWVAVRPRKHIPGSYVLRAEAENIPDQFYAAAELAMEPEGLRIVRPVATIFLGTIALHPETKKQGEQLDMILEFVDEDLPETVSVAGTVDAEKHAT